MELILGASAAAGAAAARNLLELVREEAQGLFPAGCFGHAGYGGMEGFQGLQGMLFQWAFGRLWELSSVLWFLFPASFLSAKTAFFGGLLRFPGKVQDKGPTA